MSYNWVSASTPQGRERLFQILKECGHVGLQRLDLNLFDFIRRAEDRFGTQMFCGLIDMEDNIHAYEIDEYITEHGNNLLFLDPSPTQHPDENGLLPCPFCGGKASGIQIPFNFYTVECRACKFFILERETPQLAMAAWNTRAGNEPNA